MEARSAPLVIRWKDHAECGVYVKHAGGLPSGFSLGVLGPGGVKMPQTDLDSNVFAHHFRMICGGKLCIGMQPIIEISNDSRNAMHLLNSGFFKGTSDQPNCKVAKGLSCIVLTKNLCDGEEVLLNYTIKEVGALGTPNSKLSPSLAHPQWMRDAARKKVDIPVFLRDIQGKQVFYIVPPSQHPVPLRSVSLTAEGKMALLSSFASVHGHEIDIPVRTPSLSLQTRRDLLNSFYATSVNQSTSGYKVGGGSGASGGGGSGASGGGDDDCKGSGSLARKPTLVLSHTVTATDSGKLVEPTGSPQKVNTLS